MFGPHIITVGLSYNNPNTCLGPKLWKLSFKVSITPDLHHDTLTVSSLTRVILSILLPVIPSLLPSPFVFVPLFFLLPWLTHSAKVTRHQDLWKHRRALSLHFRSPLLPSPMAKLLRPRNIAPRSLKAPPSSTPQNGLKQGCWYDSRGKKSGRTPREVDEQQDKMCGGVWSWNWWTLQVEKFWCTNRESNGRSELHWRMKILASEDLKVKGKK